jgi:cobalt-zinc-cadmium efflux system protein
MTDSINPHRGSGTVPSPQDLTNTTPPKQGHSGCSHEGHSHGHHGHGGGLHHSHFPEASYSGKLSKTFILAIGLNLLFVGAETFAAWVSNSVALLADAGHNLGDVLGLGLALLAVRLSLRPPTRRHTWGLKRSTILASLANAVALLALVFIIAREATERILVPAPVDTGIIAITALIGIGINSLTAWLLHRHDQSDVNVRGAFLHMLADAAVSAGVVVSALLISWTGWLWIDTAVSFLIAGVILAGTWHVLIESLHLNLDAVPQGLDVEEVKYALMEMAGVSEVYDLHVWRTSTTSSALSAHVIRSDLADNDGFLASASLLLRERFSIAHATLQVETKRLAAGCQS